MSIPCNQVTARHDARTAWTASSRDVVGLYLATESGVIFVRIPAQVWVEKMAGKFDSNGNPLPTASATAQAS